MKGRTITFIAIGIIAVCVLVWQANKSVVKQKEKFEELSKTVARLYQQTQYSQALDAAKEELDLARKIYRNQPQELEAIYNLAVILAFMGEDEASDELFVEAKEKVESFLNDGNVSVKEIRYNYRVNPLTLDTIVLSL